MDLESDNGSEGPPELCSSDDDEDERSNSTPAAPSAAAVSHKPFFDKFSELTAPFSPNLRAPNQIAPTQEEDDFDCERDSVRSNSSRSTRIQLQEKNRIVDQKPPDSLTPATNNGAHYLG